MSTPESELCGQWGCTLRKDHTTIGDGSTPEEHLSWAHNEEVREVTENRLVPGWEGSMGPFSSQYGQLHVYARDVHSGAGNCVCGSGLGDDLHVQAAPGVNVPESMRYRRTR